MADYANHMSYTVDLNKPITKTIWHDLFVTTSKQAHRIELQLRRGTENINFNGAVTATLITYADMLTQEETGTSEDGKAVFTFPDSFYRQNGLFSVVIFINDGETRTPVFCGEGNMSVGETDTRYDPDGVVPSLSEVLAQIEAARAAANAANKAAQDADDAAQAANDAAQAANDAGEKVDRLTASAVELSYDKQPTVETDLRDGHYHLTFGIPKGDPYTIKGHAYATLADLQAAVTNPTEGDQYNVGSAPPYNVYRWTGSAWEDQGVLQGVKGDKGDKGDPGVPGQDGASGKTPILGIDYFTQADKDAIIDEVVEATAGLTNSNLDLLWENPDSTVAFAAQTITIDTLDTYEIIAVRFRAATKWSTHSPLILYLTSETRAAGTAVSAVTENIVTRYVRINKTAKTVTFGEGSKNGDTMAYNDNTFAVPVVIYGVRWGGKNADAEKIEELESTVASLQNELNNKADVIVANASGAMVSIADGAARPAVELISHIEPAQAGSGDPSPDNVRAISGWDSASVTNDTSGQGLTTDLPETVYGGLVNWTAGEIVVDHLLTTIGTLTVSKSTTEYQTFAISGFPNALFVNNNEVTAISDRFRGLSRETISANLDNYVWATEAAPTQIRVKCTACEDMTAAQFKAAYADTQIVYRLAEPYTIQLTPQQLNVLKGVNDVWSSTGKTDLTYVADAKLYIDRKLAAIAAAALNN